MLKPARGVPAVLWVAVVLGDPPGLETVQRGAVELCESDCHQSVTIGGGFRPL